MDALGLNRYCCRRMVMVSERGGACRRLRPQRGLRLAAAAAAHTRLLSSALL